MEESEIKPTKRYTAWFKGINEHFCMILAWCLPSWDTDWQARRGVAWRGVARRGVAWHL